MKLQLADKEQAWDALYEQFQTLSQEHKARTEREKRSGMPGARSESTYLNIVGGLLTLLLGKSPNGVPYSSFETLESVISALVACSVSARTGGEHRGGELQKVPVTHPTRRTSPPKVGQSRVTPGLMSEKVL
ncbi:hypothetical protein ACOTJF_03405 [Achromobacter ruhlandii]|uniref:hypothetical protein n=1 Tax=Achromobacter ruhlandii TaxID=72557 RepID=UPI003BA39BDA